MKAPGSNSSFYLCRLTPSADSLKTGIEELLHIFPSKPIKNELKAFLPYFNV
jgi:hypothetical protein